PSVSFFLLDATNVIRICLTQVKLHGADVELATLALEDTFAANVPAARFVQQFASPIVDVLNRPVRSGIELARPEPALDFERLLGPKRQWVLRRSIEALAELVDLGDAQRRHFGKMLGNRRLAGLLQRTLPVAKRRQDRRQFPGRQSHVSFWRHGIP